MILDHSQLIAASMFYRPFQPGDFAQLYAIEELSFEPPFRFSRAYMRRLTQSPHAATWIAEEDDKLAGFAVVEFLSGRGGPAAYIQTIEVAPDSRRHGIGGGLLQRIESSARSAGAGAIWLHVDTENQSAIRLYESHGYRFESRKDGYYPRGRDAFIYRKTIIGSPTEPDSSAYDH